MDVERVKAENRIEDVVCEVMGYELRGRGKYLKPVKGTKEGGLVVNPDAQLYFWNSKGEGGDVVEFLQNEAQMPFKEAVLRLARRAGIPLELSEAEAKKLTAQRRRNDALTKIMTYLHRKLTDSAAAAAWARGRGWNDETVAGCGYWDGSKREFGEFLQIHGIPDNCTPAQAILQMPAGMFIYGHWQAGRCVYISGRSIEGKQHYNPKAETLGERRPLWNSSVRYSSDYVVLVEGQADALTLQQWDIPAVALCGVYADALTKQLERYQRVYVALDGDAVGVEAVKPIAGDKTYVMGWPHGVKDANEWLQGDGSAEDCLRQIGYAKPFILWLAEKSAHADPLKKDVLRRRVFELGAGMDLIGFTLIREQLKDALGLKTMGTLTQAIKAAEAELLAREKAKEERKVARGSDSVERDSPLRSILIKEGHDHEGHGQCVLACYAGQFAFVPEWGWIAYNGKYWEREGAQARLERAITDVLRRRQAVAREIDDSSLFQAAGASHPNVTGVRLQIQSMVTLTVGDFDADLDKLNVANGALDLRTGEVEPHHCSQRFTYCLETPYDAEADDMEWLAWLSSVMAGIVEEKEGEAWEVYQERVKASHAMDVKVMTWLQEVCGYFLTGHTKQDAFFYLYGPSRSGKGTFTTVLMSLMGRPLSAGVNISTFTADRQQDTQSFDLAPLKASRLVVASEANRHKRINATNLKQMTGEDPIRCSYKGRDHFEYMPMYKVVIASNFPLNMDADDTAAWGRARVVPFLHSYLGKEDRGLKGRLTRPECLTGVLRWAVEGAKRWYERGNLPKTPKRLALLRDLHRADQDIVAIYLDARCATADPDDDTAFTPTEDLTKDYRDWCKAMGSAGKGLASFETSLTERGFKRKQRRVKGHKNAKRGFVGIALDSGESEAEAEQKELVL